MTANQIISFYLLKKHAFNAGIFNKYFTCFKLPPLRSWVSGDHVAGGGPSHRRSLLLPEMKQYYRDNK
jgi:hypothetical protein